MRRVADVPLLPQLARDAHKGDRGRVLIIAGSVGMSGAARLCGWGALRGGAGLVTIGTPDVVQLTVAAELSCAMTLPLPSRKGALTSPGAAAARVAADQADAVAIGPGLTTAVAPFLRRFLRGLATPVVVDADALNLVAREPTLLASTKGPRVITPHVGEAERLLGRDLGDRAEAAEELADRYACVCVLKGAGTIVCDGDRYYVNKTGNPGMATGGTGDVLTGIVAARLAQGTDALDAAMQAVCVHGRAGDLAAAAVGERSMLATDLVANLGAALADLAPAPPPTKRTGSRHRPRGRR